MFRVFYEYIDFFFICYILLVDQQIKGGVPVQNSILDQAIHWNVGSVVFYMFPRESVSRERFMAEAPENTIALDGVVQGGPFFDERTRRVNFDHHDAVVREATMSTAMQVYMAIKGGLMRLFRDTGGYNIWMNDTDQDSTLAAWLLVNHHLFEGVQSIPHMSRLLSITDRWDITGGAFPMNLQDRIVRQHNWVFRPYTELRKTGALASANGAVLRDNLEAMFDRLNRFMMGEAEEVEIDTRHTMLYQGERFWIVDEIGGNEARYVLWSRGMQAFLSIVARRPDGKMVYSIGRRSRYIPFPVPRLYKALSAAEGLSAEDAWNGSDIVGGSNRKFGSGLSWEQARDVIEGSLS